MNEAARSRALAASEELLAGAPRGASLDEGVVWHELECGGYRQDLTLWRALAARCGDPVLEIGAGCGRVALDLATAGYRVTALERDRGLLAALSRRTRGLPVTPVHDDARSFRLEERFALCIVPMQTIQLLGGAPGRRAFLEAARGHLREGGLLAAAIVERLVLFRATDGAVEIAAEACALGGVLYRSRPTAVTADRTGFVLKRRRETVATTGARSVVEHSEHLDRLTCAELEAEGVAMGFAPAGRTSVPATEEHTGSAVVMLRA